MFGEVPHEHVAPGPREAGRGEVLGAERLGQPLEQPADRRETVEDRGVASRVGGAAFDDVAAVLAVLGGSAEEFLAARQRVTDGVP